MMCVGLFASMQTAQANNFTVLVVGDSLSAEYGLPRGTGWVSLLQNKVQSSHASYQVVNASISGDTTSGGLARLPMLLKRHNPRVVLIELGGNDALRGLSLAATESNLQAMIRASQAAKAQVLLVSMQIPPNYGAAYTESFTQLYGKLAQQNHLPKPPFLLEKIATRPELFQADHIHPTVAAQAQMLNNVWPSLQALLK